MLESLTVKVATPLAFVVPETVVIVDEPEPAASVTSLPVTAFAWASSSVTVTVEVVEPLATTEAGDAPTVETDADTAPGTNWTEAVGVSASASVESVAL